MIWKKGIWLLLLCLVLGLSGGFGGKKETPPLIRLHILAHSDQAEDQLLKYKVRDQIIKIMREEFADCQSLAESRLILLKRLAFLEEKTKALVAEAGFPYSAQALYGQFEFPAKDYEAFLLPAGRYEALRLVLGEGRGANWWCVLFPPLCFIESEQSLVLEGEGLEDLAAVQIKPALKIKELWQEIFKGTV